MQLLNCSFFVERAFAKYILTESNGGTNIDNIINGGFLIRNFPPKLHKLLNIYIVDIDPS